MPMTLIARTTLSGTAASVVFTNIPQTFQTLRLMVSARTDEAVTWANATIYFNGANSNITERFLYGNGSGAASGTGTAIEANGIDGANTTASTFGNLSMDVPNYSGSSYKAVSLDHVTENNATSSIQIMTAALWSQTPAISVVTVAAASTKNFVAGSTFSLYGIG